MLTRNVHFVILSFVLFMAIGFSGSFVKADGLELEEETAEKPSTVLLDAPPPPLVEDETEADLIPLEEEDPIAVILAAPPAPKEDPWPSISQGMIILKPSQEGRIVAAEDQKKMLGQGDLVYLKTQGVPFLPNQEWVVFKSVKDVFHPKTKVPMGELVHVLGLVKVIDISEQVATARVTRSTEPMERGDRIAFLEQFIPLTTEKGVAPKKGTEAFVVDVKDGRNNNGQHDIVYIDYGKANGITPGDRFIVVHEAVRNDTFSETTQKDTSLPYRKVGTMVVLATQAHTATAKIIQSIEPILKGDTLLFDPDN